MATQQEIGNALAGFGAGFRGQGGQFLQGLSNRETQQRQQREKLTEQRRLAMLSDFKVLNEFVNVRGDSAGGARFIGKRIKDINRLGGDPSQSVAIQAGLLSTDTADQEETARGIKDIVDTATIRGEKGFEAAQPSALDVAKTGQAEATTAKTLKQTELLGQPKKTPPIGPKERAEIKKILAETAKFNREAGAGADTPVQKQERLETVKKNVSRISELSKGSATRASSVKKARKFLRAFQTGTKTSGAGRKSASFVPGVFTAQGQFDEELGAFAEVAAREKLKAVGEIRPTDADVEGMKRALFGIGRDEQTNINLLQQFIGEQDGLDDELDALRDAKTSKTLDTFTGVQNVPVEVDF